MAAQPKHTVRVYSCRGSYSRSSRWSGGPAVVGARGGRATVRLHAHACMRGGRHAGRSARARARGTAGPPDHRDRRADRSRCHAPKLCPPPPPPAAAAVAAAAAATTAATAAAAGKHHVEQSGHSCGKQGRAMATTSHGAPPTPSLAHLCLRSAAVLILLLGCRANAHPTRPAQPPDGGH